MRRVGFMLLAIIGGAFGCGIRHAPTIDADPVTDGIDLVIYQAMIDYLAENDSANMPLVLADSTSTRWAADRGQLLRDSSESRAHPFIQDLVARNQRSVRIRCEDLLPVRRPIVCVPGVPGGRGGMAAGVSGAWLEVRHLVPGATSLVAFSRPAFAPTGGAAYVIVERWFAPDAPRRYQGSLTLELRWRKQRWMPYRLQFLPPKPGL